MVINELAIEEILSLNTVFPIKLRVPGKQGIQTGQSLYS